MKKRGLVILGVVVLLGAWLMVVGYEFLEKENARFQKNVKAAKEEQQRCAARNSKYRNYDQFRTSIRVPYTTDLLVGALDASVRHVARGHERVRG